MDQLVEYWIPIAVILGTFLGAFATPIIGYFRKPKAANGRISTIYGATTVDSKVAQDLVVALNRIAEVCERIEHQMKDTADAEAEARRTEAAVEAARVKWEREQRG